MKKLWNNLTILFMTCMVLGIVIIRFTRIRYDLKNRDVCIICEGMHEDACYILTDGGKGLPEKEGCILYLKDFYELNPKSPDSLRYIKGVGVNPSEIEILSRLLEDEKAGIFFVRKQAGQGPQNLRQLLRSSFTRSPGRCCECGQPEIRSIHSSSMWRYPTSRGKGCQ